MESRLTVSQRGKMPLKQPEHSQFHLGTFPLNKRGAINERKMFSVCRLATPESPFGMDIPILSGFPNLLHLVEWITHSVWKEMG